MKTDCYRQGKEPVTTSELRNKNAVKNLNLNSIGLMLAQKSMNQQVTLNTLGFPEFLPVYSMVIWSKRENLENPKVPKFTLNFCQIHSQQGNDHIQYHTLKKWYLRPNLNDCSKSEF
jgi:hypothetical protein